MIFLTTLLSKSCPIFDELSAYGFTKFGNFILTSVGFWPKTCCLGPRQLARQKSKYSLTSGPDIDLGRQLRTEPNKTQWYSL